MLYDVVAGEARAGFKVWVRFENGGAPADCTLAE